MLKCCIVEESKKKNSHCRYFREKLVRQTGQAENQGVVGPSSTNDAAPHPEIYEKVEGNDGYQELGDLSRPSLYDGLDQNKL